MLVAALVLAAWGVSAAPPAPAPPQVVVSVKYGPRGNVDGLLVAQYRLPAPQAPAAAPPPQNGSVWSPAISQQRRICSDLCAAGLGGLACGQSCTDITPSELIQLYRERAEKSFFNKITDAQANQHPGSFHIHYAAKNNEPDVGHKRERSQRPSSGRHNQSSHENEIYSLANNTTTHSGVMPDGPEHNYSNAPRTEVCPTLCTNDLGWPLCECSATPPSKMQWAGPSSGQGAEPHWSDVCSSFCPLNIRGCAPCADLIDGYPDGAPGYAIFSGQEGVRVLDTTAGWIEWCSYQCSRGEGGAACNCDRAPFF